jgi:hypothetical protein
MEKIKLNEYQNIFYFIWDDKDETIEMTNRYLKITKGSNWSCGRCLESDVLFIQIKDSIDNMNCFDFYTIGQYVIDFGDTFWGMSKEDFDKGDFISNWKQNHN